MVEVESVETALLEAIMERDGKQDQELKRGEDKERPASHEEPSPPPAPLTTPENVDPQGPEVKSLPMMSPAASKRVGASPGQQWPSSRGDEDLSRLVRELQLQLREKEEELGRQRRTGEREVREREEQVARLTREGAEAGEREVGSY